MEKKTREEIERKMTLWISTSFDAIQKVLDKKAKSNDINLDIDMKIHSKLHQTLVEVRKHLLQETNLK